MTNLLSFVQDFLLEFFHLILVPLIYNDIQQRKFYIFIISDSFVFVNFFVYFEDYYNGKLLLSSIVFHRLLLIFQV